MADGYWRYGDARHQAQAAMAPPQPPMKRPRPDYGDVPAGSEYVGYYPREEGRAGHRVIRDTESISASYDRYLRDGIVSYGGGESLRPVAGGMGGHPVDDLRMMGVGGMDGRSVGYGSGRPETPLPPDASCTLFVEGLPANCTRREVSHIFRPFAGFREVRLVNKESRHPGGDPLVLCFVDFSTPSQAAVALDALQGYKFDEHDRDSANLRLQFARFPGPRSAGGPRGRR
ncbi:RNA-binding protein 1 isoform X2 [Phoenix dactylifera]|uniref:RNA-binding protein 1 isoform X2 n=1 Tax=Phoenix dactylifera TaxID=42345 RepID=A0A8B7C2W0_PHODC|nr:RNA-binding protein 1 isoform X2 [Phoenix dactylifera]